MCADWHGSGAPGEGGRWSEWLSSGDKFGPTLEGDLPDGPPLVRIKIGAAMNPAEK